MDSLASILQDLTPEMMQDSKLRKSVMTQLQTGKQTQVKPVSQLKEHSFYSLPSCAPPKLEKPVGPNTEPIHLPTRLVATKSSVVQPWQCNECTFYNETLPDTCEACGGRRSDSDGNDDAIF